MDGSSIKPIVPRHATALFILIIFLSCIARLYELDRLSLWADELWVVMDSAQGTLWDMLRKIYYHDNHPPGYYLISRYTQFILGSSDFAIRLPSAVAGIGLVAATYITAKKLFSLESAAIASTLVSGSYQAIYYSQEARPNIFMALFMLLSFYYFYKLVFEKSDSRKDYILFWFTASVANYLHYTSLVFCVCLFICYLAWLISNRTKSNFFLGIKLFFPVLFIYAPWIPGTLQHLTSTPVTAWQRVPDLKTLDATFRFLFGPDLIQINFFRLIVLITLVYLCVVLVRLTRGLVTAEEKNRFIVIIFILAMVVLPVLVFFFKSRHSQSAYNHRHFLHAIPFVSIVAGFFITVFFARLNGLKRHLIVGGCVCLIFLYQYFSNRNYSLYTANHFKQDYREGAEVVTGDYKFMQLPTGAIVSNATFFDHYLLRLSDGKRKADTFYEHADTFSQLQLFLNDKHITEFYYLEAPLIPGANGMITAEDMVLISHFTPICRSKLIRVQAIKFQTAAPTAMPEDLPSCH